MPIEDWARIFDVSFAEPSRVWLGVGLALLLLAIPFVRRTRSRARRAWLPLVLRGLGLACLLAVLLKPYLEWTTIEMGRVIALFDVSPSMGEDGRRALEQHRATAPGGVEFFTFGNDVLPHSADQLNLRTAPGTDIGSALRRAAAEHAEGRPLRVVLFSDGRATTVGAREAARDLRRHVVTFDAVALPERLTSARAQVRAAFVRLLPRAARDAPFVLEMRVHADAAGTSVARLYIDGKQVEERRLALAVGEQSISFAAFSPTPGRHEVQVLLEGDDSPADNAAWTHFVAPGTPRALLLAAKERKSLIAQALAAQDMEVSVATPGVPLDQTDVVVLLPDAPRDASYDALSEFVGKGGGLVAIGGSEGEGLARLHGKPISFLLPLAVDARPPAPPPPPPPDPEPKEVPRIEIEEREIDAFPISLCLVIDRSGSMTGPKWERAKAAAVAAADALTKQDRIVVIAFGDKAELVVAPQPAGLGHRVARTLRHLEATGQTAMFAALEGALKVMRAEPSPIRHVVLLSDGLPSDEGRWRDLLRAMTGEKITLSSVGIGWDFDKQFLLRLSQWGRGKYWSANHPTDIPQVVTQDTLRVVEARDDKRRDAERARPRKDKEPEENKPPPPTPKDPTPPQPPTPPQAAPIVANPAVPREMLAGVEDDRLPAVAGFEEGKLRFSAWSAALAGIDGPPLLSYWRVGLGRVAVFAADPEADATQALRNHEEFSRLMAQLVRSVLPDASREPIAVTARFAWDRSGERLQWSVRGEDGALRSDVELTARVGQDSLPITRRGGVYEIDLGARAGRTHVVTTFGPVNQPLLTRTVVVPPSRPHEPLGLDVDRAALLDLVGDPERLNPQRDRLWQRPVITKRHRRPLDLPFLALAAILLPLDAWARRSIA